MSSKNNRRDFMKTSLAAAAGASMPYWYTTQQTSAAYKSALERPVVGCIGTGSRWNAVGPQAMKFADCAAVCDVDANHMGSAHSKVTGIQKKAGKDLKVDRYEDYQKILDRDDIDIVTIVTPDHWHSKIAIEAMQAGKDVYCEKPLTLTIEEGKQIIKVLKETKRVFQVGTQQRSEMGKRFLQAVALVRNGRIGKVKRVTCAIGGAPQCDSLPVVDVPSGLNWDKWLGQAPSVDYRSDAGSGKKKRRASSRCHYEFRWWYEYSGGKMTDWGAHHVDIAQWAIDQNGEDQGPTKMVPIMAKHPVPYKNGWPTMDDQYNTATEFKIEAHFADDIVMHIRHSAQEDLGMSNGIMFEGTKGRFMVNRGKITGKPVEDLKDNPLPEGAIAEVYGGEEPTSHMENFMNCVKSRELPISDVYSHHRAMTTCHLANIAIRLNRTLNWDPVEEQMVDDSEANTFQAREQRKGYEINVSV